MQTTTDTPLRWAYIGNFRPEHSTENHVKAALERIGHHVTPLQEDDLATWDYLDGNPSPPDVILWTRTGWDPPVPHDLQRKLLMIAEDSEVPTVGYHLDRWWGLNREGQVREEPFFRCSLVCTADGGHADQWAEAGVNHRWMPPGVLLAEVERPWSGERSPLLGRSGDIVWVGSWRSYHPEWQPYRHALIQQLTRRYRRRLVVLPRPGQSIRGAALTELYGSAVVVIGDSCLAGGATHYWSDRVPETLGRGGLLVHPDVPGLRDNFDQVDALALYTLGDWPGLFDRIDALAALSPEARQARSDDARSHVIHHHTYEARMLELTDVLMGSRGLA